MCGTATERDSGPDTSWTDTDGYGQHSRLVTVGKARDTTSTDLPPTNGERHEKRGGSSDSSVDSFGRAGGLRGPRPGCS